VLAVLVIITDDQRWDALSVVQKEQGEKGRFPWLKTPNLDRIATEGIRFRNAFVVNSLCAPSRASLVTGQYGHVNGVTNNEPNLVQNIRPTRSRARLILRKASDHTVDTVYLRKL
jgi:arylsulfatase A-like enzyme